MFWLLSRGILRAQNRLKNNFVAMAIVFSIKSTWQTNFNFDEELLWWKLRIFLDFYTIILEHKRKKLTLSYFLASKIFKLWSLSFSFFLLGSYGFIYFYCLISLKMLFLSEDCTEIKHSLLDDDLSGKQYSQSKEI
jgi:hypothetical protein